MPANYALSVRSFGSLVDGTEKLLHDFLNKIALDLYCWGSGIDLMGLEDELEG
jgi:hypothetical protein